MNKFTFLPSPNWNLPHIVAVNDTGKLCSYGSRGDVVLILNADSDSPYELDNCIFSRAHKSKTTGVVFLTLSENGQEEEYIASCGEDGNIKIWNVKTQQLSFKCNPNLLVKEKGRLVDIDWIRGTNMLICLLDNGFVAKWDLACNKLYYYVIPIRSLLNTLSSCPHDPNLIALGGSSGLLIVYSIRGEGTLLHKFRCHESDVCSVAWCPVAYNVIQLKKELENNPNFDEEEFKKTDKTMLLACCSKDRSIYICRAGTDAYCETVAMLPLEPLYYNQRYNKNNKQSGFTNVEKVRPVKWVLPSVLLVATDFCELITLDISEEYSENTTAPNRKSMFGAREYKMKVIHKQHKRNINAIATTRSISSADNNITVWTCSSDRMLMKCSSMEENSSRLLLPTLGGYVYCLSICPNNPDLLAIAMGDSKIFLWNMSCAQYVDVTVLWKKVDAKVMTVAWHPKNEGLLAFGTSEGRVGIFDTSQGWQQPTVMKLYHSKPIYRLAWAHPILRDHIPEKAYRGMMETYYLYAIGNGEIVQYNTLNRNEVPISLKELFKPVDEQYNFAFKTDFCFELNRTEAAIGHANGNIYICNSLTMEVYQVIRDHCKPVVSMAFHPKVVTSKPNDISPYSNLFAVAAECVSVYKIHGYETPLKLASLQMPAERVNHVCWNPHVNCQLLTASHDFTVQIWDVLKQTMIACYSGHHAQVFCAVWSPSCEDIVISGSSDTTCRAWSISKDTSPSYQKKGSKKDSEKELNGRMGEPTLYTPSKIVKETCGYDTKKPKPKGLFPSINSNLNNQSSRFKSIVGRHVKLFQDDPAETQKDTKEAEPKRTQKDTKEVEPVETQKDSKEANGIAENNNEFKESTELPKPNFSDFKLFNTDEELKIFSKYEENILLNSGVNQSAWSVIRLDFKDQLEEAIRTNKVTKNMVALATSVSPKLWKEACTAYIEQQIASEDYVEAMTFLLAIGKVEEAINLLIEKRLFREAYAIARIHIKEPEQVENVLKKWADSALQHGVYRLSAVCLLELGQKSQASNVLSRSKLVEDVYLGAMILKEADPYRDDLAIECFKRFMSKRKWSRVDALFNNFSNIKFLQAWYLISKKLDEENDAIEWCVSGLNDTDLIKGLPRDLFDYNKLRPYVLDSACSSNTDQVLLCVSGQLTLFICAWYAEKRDIATEHLIKALKMAYNNVVVSGSLSNASNDSILGKLVQLIAPKGPMSDMLCLDIQSEEIIADKKRTINAFIGDTSCNILTKYRKQIEEEKNGELGQENNEENQKNDEYEEGIKNRGEAILSRMKELFGKYLEDILDKDAVDYYKNVAALKQLEYTSKGVTNINVTSKQKEFPVGTGENGNGSSMPRQPIHHSNEVHFETNEKEGKNSVENKTESTIVSDKSKVENDCVEMEEGLAAVSDMANGKDDTTTMEGDTTALKDNITNGKKDCTEMKGDVTALKDMTNGKQDCAKERTEEIANADEKSTQENIIREINEPRVLVDEKEIKVTDKKESVDMRCIFTRDITQVRDLVENFEKTRIAVPNPAFFYYITRDFLANEKVQFKIAQELEALLTEQANKCGIIS